MRSGCEILVNRIGTGALDSMALTRPLIEARSWLKLNPEMAFCSK